MLQRWSEPYAPTGGLAAEGVLNQLGRPGTEPLEVLVREAVQNCWDARRPDEQTVGVQLGYRVLDDAERHHLVRRVLPDPPRGLALGDALAGPVDLLYFADRGTTGLGGPTRMDVPQGDSSDFVDFVRNVGQPPDKTLGGGSYGYGKAAFYLSSCASTIIVDTYCFDENERRVIAYGLGAHHRVDGLAYTGRHWWGLLRDGVPEPATGPDANELADGLGLPSRRTRSDAGTTVAIVAPRLEAAAGDGDVRGADLLPFIAECLVWNFWPKMVAAPGSDPAMRFEIVGPTGGIPVPDPRSHARLAPFTVAMDALRSDGTDASDPFTEERVLSSERPRRELGNLAVHRTPSFATGRAGPLTHGARETADGLHHAALMRNAELVVRYQRGPAPAVPGRGYAGVFRCHVSLDELFRRSEPPTHDTWEPTALIDRTERTFVRVALRRVAEALHDIAGPRTGGGALGETAAVPLGRFADDLAGLMPTMTGPGARRPAPTRTSSSGRRTAGGPGGGGGGGLNGVGWEVSETQADLPRIGTVGAGELQVTADGASIRSEFELRTAGRPCRLIGRVDVVTMDGGQVESEPPMGTKTPEVTGWTDPTGREYAGPAVAVPADASGTWTVWTRHEPELMIRLGVEVRGG